MHNLTLVRQLLTGIILVVRRKSAYNLRPQLRPIRRLPPPLAGEPPVDHFFLVNNIIINQRIFIAFVEYLITFIHLHSTTLCIVFRGISHFIIHVCLLVLSVIDLVVIIPQLQGRRHAVFRGSSIILLLGVNLRKLS